VRYLLLFAVLFTSCSAEKRIAKFVKKEGPKEVASFMVREYPEYFRSDSARVDTLIKTEVEIVTPEVVFDTFYVKPTDKGFTYQDKNLLFTIDSKGKLSYKIFSKTIKEIVEVPVKMAIACPPCPTQAVVDKAKEEMYKTLLKEKNKRRGWPINYYIYILLLIAGIVYFLKFRK
jgi:hypothetical protein